MGRVEESRQRESLDSMQMEIDRLTAALAGRPIPSDWSAGSRALRWGAWNEAWPVSLLKDIQEWGHAHSCRFILVAENDPPNGHKEYQLSLYAAPVPNRLVDGLDEPSISNRDRNLRTFGAWLEGFLTGKGLMRPQYGFQFP